MAPSGNTGPGLQGGGLSDVLRRTAQRHPSRIAVRFGEATHTYAGLDETCDRCANALMARGVRKGDRVALLSRNSEAFIVIAFAAARLGAVLTPINFMLTAVEIAFILDHSEASAFIAEGPLVEVAEAALILSERRPSLLASIGSAGEHTRSWEPVSAWLEHPDATRCEIRVENDDPIQLLYTSGTESRPKGAALSSAGLIAQYVSCIHGSGLSTEDRILHALPLFHCAQMHCFMGPGLYVGATNIILSHPDPLTILRTIAQERVTQFFAPPTVWISLLRHSEFDDHDLSSLRTGYYGAAIMPRELILELTSRLPRLGLFNFYGQTEMGPLATLLEPSDQLRKLGSAGKAALNVQTRIEDEAGQPVPAGVEGEIVHRGPHVMLGYWKDPERTAEAFRGGWFHSGDLGVMDDEGYLTVVDRKKDMIKTGGENVASREVEEVLYEHPGVAEAAVVGAPDPRWIEAVSAVIVLRPEAEVTEADLIAHCRDRLAGFKTPKRIVFVDSLPRNASGKILKRELKGHFSG